MLGLILPARCTPQLAGPLLFLFEFSLGGGALAKRDAPRPGVIFHAP